MGCSSARENLTPEEFAITKEETSLGYSTTDVRQIVMITMRYGREGKMSKP
jgi:hypothetical protein